MSGNRAVADAGAETPLEPAGVDRGRGAADALFASFRSPRGGPVASSEATRAPRRPVVVASQGVHRARRWNGVAGARAVRAGIARATPER